MIRTDTLRRKALENMKEHEVLMLDGHFDYGNGFHGRVYLNPHQIFREPSLIWRFAQDLIGILPETVVAATQVVAGPVMGGALLAHTLAGLMDGRRSLTHPPTSFAPLSLDSEGRLFMRPFYHGVVRDKRVLLVDDADAPRRTHQTERAVRDMRQHEVRNG
jgi:orotate phosphoribosyltransferase